MPFKKKCGFISNTTARAFILLCWRKDENRKGKERMATIDTSLLTFFTSEFLFSVFFTATVTSLFHWYCDTYLPVTWVKRKTSLLSRNFDLFLLHLKLLFPYFISICLMALVIPRSKNTGRFRQESTGSHRNVEAVFQPENFRIFSDDFRPVPAGKHRELIGIHWKKIQ